MKKTKYIIIFVLLAAALLAGWFFLSHTYVGGGFYPKNADVLNLQNKAITAEQYHAIHEKMPDCEIFWNVPFQGNTVPSQTAELTVAELTEADLEDLAYFPDLKKINAEGCTNYALLFRLKEQYPELDVHYTVTIDGTSYPGTADTITISSISDKEIELLQYLPSLSCVDARNCDDLDQLLKVSRQVPGCEVLYCVSIGGNDVNSDAEELVLTGAEPMDVLAAMPYLPELRTVELKEPVEDLENLAALCKQYPNVEFRWELDVLGVTISTEDTEVDLSGTDIASVDYVEAALACFPNLEKVYLGECGLDNDELAAYRDRVRPEYKVVWLLRLGLMPMRTDATFFMPGMPDDRYYVTDKQMNLLRYCEDLICVDVGHQPAYHCEWASSLHNLKYLIMTDTHVKDLTPLIGLENLVFLELSSSRVADYSPLLQVTCIEDLNLGWTNGTAEDAQVVKQMTWLKRLWWNKGPIPQAELQEALPNTVVRVYVGSSNGNGWRESQNYRDMRDTLGLWYHIY